MFSESCIAFQMFHGRICNVWPDVVFGVARGKPFSDRQAFDREFETGNSVAGDRVRKSGDGKPVYRERTPAWK